MSRSIFTNLNVDFLGKVKYTFVLSIILIAISVYSLSTKWLNLGLDFTGGVTVDLQADSAIDVEKIRSFLLSANYSDAQVQRYGGDDSIQIKLPPQDSATVSQDLKQLLDKEMGLNFKVISQSIVGSQFGQELVDRGTMALFLAIIGILIYISFRFQWKLALGGVASLAHDLTITLGFFSITQLSFDLTVLAALLAVLGYSVNDTVVVFDRIRENFRVMHKGSEKDIVNLSINQTMSRTIITSFTTLLSVLALAFFGGPILFSFAIALIVGIGIGTYSSIYVASALALKLGLAKNDLIPKDPEEIDDMP